MQRQRPADPERRSHLLNNPSLAVAIPDGFALEDIAAVTGAPLGTVKSRLYRGLNLLMGRSRTDEVAPGYLQAGRWSVVRRRPCFRIARMD
jgi:hypothetical protein